jgi:hypothetical protein
MRSNRNWAAEMDVRWARQERAEYHGRTEEEARELRMQAARSATCCSECFRPLAPMDSVTMQGRKVSKHYWPRVPICLLCTLNEVIKLRTTDGATFYIPPRWHRARCLNCGRPLRIYSLSLTTRACCFDCRRQAKNKRNAERRRVRHEPMTCIECGRAFTPKRADAVTCSNRCRQAQHRKRERAELAASGSRYAPAVRARVRSRAPSRR